MLFSSLNPLARGARIVLRNGAGATELDVTLPAGAYGGSGTRGWRLLNTGKTWNYTDTSSSPIGAIVKVLFDDRTTVAPGRIGLTVTGDDGTYPVVQGDEPINASVTAGNQTDAAAGLCGESAYVASNCTWNASRNQLTCMK